MCIWICKCVCAHMHLSPCVFELFASPPQALSCWVCSLKRLCFCYHPPPPPSVHSLSGFSLILFSPSVLSARLHHSPSLSSVHLCSIIDVSSLDKKLRGPLRSTLCCLRAKLVSSGSSESIIKLFMQRVWPLTISLLFEASWGVYVYACVRIGERRQWGSV